MEVIVPDRSHITPAVLQKLRQQAIESTDQCQALAQEAGAQKELIDKTRLIIAELTKQIELVDSIRNRTRRGHHSAEKNKRDEREALELIQIFVTNLNIARNVLKKEDDNYKLVQLRLKTAFQLAKKHAYMLSEAQNELVASRVQEYVDEEEKPENYVPWYSEQVPERVVMPPKDPKTQRFFDQLDENSKMMFEDIHRILFWLAYMKYPANKFSAERKNFEFLVTARMTTVQMRRGGSFSLDDHVLEPLRARAIKLLEAEQKNALGARIVNKIKFTEFYRRQRVNDWIEMQKNLHITPPRPPPKLKPTLKSIVSKNIGLSTGCKPILTEYYEDLKSKHLRLVNCKKFLEIVARQKTPNKIDRILIIQLRKMLKNNQL